MAGAGYKLFNTGDVLTAQQVNEYLQQQTVMVFADASARTTALSGVLAEGMVSYLKDQNKMYVYDGSNWIDASSELPSQTGNSGKYLTTDGTTASWGTVSGGGYTLISEQTASALSSLSFSSISSSYKHLYLTWSGIYHSATGSSFQLRFNNNSSSYLLSVIGGYGGTFNGSGPQSYSATGTSDYPLFGKSIYDPGMSTSDYATGWIFIENYASTTKEKVFQAWTHYQDWSYDRRYVSMQGRWSNTSAISSLDIVRTAGTATFTTAANNSIRLYGVS